MESWQADYIQKNLKHLLEMTDCNGLLLWLLEANGVLSGSDLDGLKSMGPAHGRHAQCARLYQVLLQKLRGYEVLANALYQCEQTGALMILLDGFRQRKIPDPLTKCDILVSYASILESKVHFQGRTDTLLNIFPYITEKDISEALANSEFQYDYIDIFNAKAKPFVLTESAISARPEIYIPRSISNSLELNPRIFKEECPDVFVLKGIDRIHLTRLASPNGTAISTDQICEVTSRFILLTEDVDWEDLVTLCANRNLPVHLIRCETNDCVGDGGISYILEETHGTSNVLWGFVDRHSEENRPYISEEQFIKNTDKSHSNGFAICDSAGMGKTYILAHLARTMSIQHPERIVVFFQLNKLAEYTTKCYDAKTSNGRALEQIIDFISPTNFSRAILLKEINLRGLRLELFFDGLDEVRPDHFKLTMTFLKNLITDIDGSVRVYVTTRPHMKRETETTLGVISYDMLPFTL